MQRTAWKKVNAGKFSPVAVYRETAQTKIGEPSDSPVTPKVTNLKKERIALSCLSAGAKVTIIPLRYSTQRDNLG
jgi:hypothetical protein